MKIYKLKVIKVNQYYLEVITEKEEKGTIYIDEIAYYYIDNLNDLFSTDDEIYGVNIGEYNKKKSFSLKKGHSFKDKKIFKETGGGFLGLQKFLSKMEE